MGMLVLKKQDQIFGRWKNQWTDFWTLENKGKKTFKTQTGFLLLRYKIEIQPLCEVLNVLNACMVQNPLPL